MLGRIAAGTPIEALSDPTRFISVPSDLLGRGEYYCLEVDGDSMIEAGMSMFILETEPAGYVLIAANEAEKASNITIVDVKGVGAFGRMTLAGKEGDVEEAAAAAMRAIDQINR